jgi:glutaredoxin
MITIYSKPNCPHCVASKQYLARLDIAYEEINVSENAEALAFIRSEGHRTVPQLYVNGKLLVEGGNSGLQKLPLMELRERIDASLLGCPRGSIPE